MLDRDAILKVNDLEIKRVDIPVWGGEVCIRVMTAAQQERVEHLAGMIDDEKLDPSHCNRAIMAVFTICDEKGNLLFTEEDIPLLAQKNKKALIAIGREAMELNSLTEEAQRQAVKNLETPQDDSLPTD